MLPSIPPLTDCRPPCHHSRQPRLLSLCLHVCPALHCPALHCPALGTVLHSPARHRSGSTAARALGLGHDRLCLQPRNLHSGFEVTVTGRWQKPTVAVVSVSQAHATSVGRAADLRLTTHRPSTVVLWHTPRLNNNNNAWDPLTIVVAHHRPHTPTWGNTRKACIMQRTQICLKAIPSVRTNTSHLQLAGHCVVHRRRVQT